MLIYTLDFAMTQFQNPNSFFAFESPKFDIYIYIYNIMIYYYLKDFWKLNEFRYDSFEWPNSTSGPLNKDYSFEDYLDDRNILKERFEIIVRGLIYVQVYHTEKETG